MKYLLLVSIMLSFTQNVRATTTQKLDTIYANDKMNLALFFPAEIRQGLVGAEHFVFTYNREKGQSLGLLKAIKGAPSNLLVITVDGNIYSYVICYTEHLSIFNRFITKAERIGDQSGEKLRSRTAEVVDTSAVLIQHRSAPTSQHTKQSKPNIDFIVKSCKSLLVGPQRRNDTKQKQGISLGVKNKVYYNELLFVQFEIKNTSGIDFDLDALNMKKIQGNGNRKASYQETVMNAVHTHNLPPKVRHGDTIGFVRVYKKTTLGHNEYFQFELKEANGSREVVLKIMRQ